MEKKNKIKSLFLWLGAVLVPLLWGGVGGGLLLTSCDDFFNQESSDVLYANQEHLNNAVDTTWSVVGILGKLQAVADRTVLLGEVRGDLVDLTLNANGDLRDVANFCVSDSNRYNQPSDYYAVINNCNYYIAHVDTALRSNNEPVFMAEYAAVKGIRAWTYLQLALNYGRVPLFTDPLLSREAAEAAEKSNKAGIEDVCTFFLQDLASLPKRYNTEYPFRGISITGVNNTNLLFFPLSLLRGELYLWRASATGSVNDYRMAAQQYFQFISERNGQEHAYATSLQRLMWYPGTTAFNSADQRDWKVSYSDAPITVIPGNSLPANGFYSELFNLFNSNSDNNYQVSIEPAQRIIDISSAQNYCLPSSNGRSFTIAPKGLARYQSGDLRLSRVYDDLGTYTNPYTEEKTKLKTISKHRTDNITVYRGIMVYLHLAEALNGAGYPRMAFLILSKGLSNEVIQAEAIPYYMTDDRADSTFLAQFDFDDKLYEVCEISDYLAYVTRDNYQLGIHSRGSGWTPENVSYRLPNDTIEPDLQKRQQLVAEQQVVVDSLLLNEEALELAFEGTRYYDLMRFAMRSSNPGAFMAKHIYARRGEERRGELQAEVKADFNDRSNWFLKWNGKMGYNE